MQHVSSLLRMASEPVLLARVKLTMAADPAVEHPLIAPANIDLNGRLIPAQAAGQTMREAVGHACDRLRIRLGRTAQNLGGDPGGQPAGEPGEWRLAHETPDEPPPTPNRWTTTSTCSQRSQPARTASWTGPETGTGWRWPTRGNLMYHRHDGHYGLIGPAG